MKNATIVSVLNLRVSRSKSLARSKIQKVCRANCFYSFCCSCLCETEKQKPNSSFSSCKAKSSCIYLQWQSLTTVYSLGSLWYFHLWGGFIWIAHIVLVSYGDTVKYSNQMCCTCAATELLGFPVWIKLHVDNKAPTVTMWA